MSANLKIQQQAGEIARAKAAAKECLVAADKYLKARLFDKAREEVEKAKEIDEKNPYISAFEERINIFESQIKAIAQKESSKQPAKPVPEPLLPLSPAPKEQKHANSLSPQRTPTPPTIEHAEPQPALKNQIDEMSKQISELTLALMMEKKNREEVQKKQLETSLRQLRSAVEDAWRLGAPKEPEREKYIAIANSLAIEPDLLASVERETKLTMYGKAVKDVLAKRKLLRSSSNTMEWLRKVYQVSMAEYLEYESRFLIDLVTDQFRGTMLLIMSSDQARREYSSKMKASGFAVVAVPTAEDALEKIEKVSPTIVLCEPEIPGGRVSGLMFLQLLRVNSKFSFLPFIFICSEEDIDLVNTSELRPNEGAVLRTADFDELNIVINEKLAQLRNYISTL